MRDICSGTMVNWRSCIKYDGEILQEVNFTGVDNQYSFAVDVVEDKPCFPGDALYYNGERKIIQNTGAIGLINKNNWSWIPPALKIELVDLSAESNPSSKYDLKIVNEKAKKAEREACADLIDKIGYSHTAGLNQFISSEFARAAELIRNRGAGKNNAK